MPNAYGELRTSARQVSVTFRMPVEDREQLRREAAELGLTQQQLFEQRILGAARPVGVPGRRRKSRVAPGQEALPQSA
jgi:hypothetical protein